MINEKELKEASKFVNRTIAGMEGHGSINTRKGNVFKTLRALIDMRTPQIPDLEGDGEMVYDTWICPSCETRYEVEFGDYEFCPNCGQRITTNTLFDK